MQSSSQYISVVIPAKNEAGNIMFLISEIIANLQPMYEFEIIYIDDGSSDETSHNVLTMMSEHEGIVRL